MPARSLKQRISLTTLRSDDQRKIDEEYISIAALNLSLLQQYERTVSGPVLLSTSYILRLRFSDTEVEVGWFGIHTITNIQSNISKS